MELRCDRTLRFHRTPSGVPPRISREGTASGSAGTVPPVATGATGDLTEFEGAVAGVLERLEPGDVVTYGEVATEAGYPGRARAVGRFLATRGSSYPWWRVVDASGRLVPGHEAEQARRLRGEGTPVDTKVRMSRR